MRAAIITEGGKNIGFGHITRCLSIAEAFKEKGWKTTFIVNDDAALKEILKDEEFKTYRSSGDYLWEILEYIHSEDIVFIDSYKLTLQEYEHIRGAVSRIVYYDDNNRLNYPPGIIVNGSVYANSLSYPRNPDNNYLLGTSYVPIRREFMDVDKRKIKQKIQSVLITFGGDDLQEMTEWVRDCILTELSDVLLHVVVGKAFRNYQTFKKSQTLRVQYHSDIKAIEMKNLMCQVDLAISAGGQTLHELARTGTPTIGICVAENQVNNLEGWQKKGFLKFCGWYNNPYLVQRLREALELVHHKRLREKMSRAGQRFVDGRGAQRTVIKILEMIK